MHTVVAPLLRASVVGSHTSSKRRKKHPCHGNIDATSGNGSSSRSDLTGLQRSNQVSSHFHSTQAPQSPNELYLSRNTSPAKERQSKLNMTNSFPDETCTQNKSEAEDKMLPAGTANAKALRRGVARRLGEGKFTQQVTEKEEIQGAVTNVGDRSNGEKKQMVKNLKERQRLFHEAVRANQVRFGPIVHQIATQSPSPGAPIGANTPQHPTPPPRLSVRENSVIEISSDESSEGEAWGPNSNRLTPHSIHNKHSKVDRALEVSVQVREQPTVEIEQTQKGNKRTLDATESAPDQPRRPVKVVRIVAPGEEMPNQEPQLHAQEKDNVGCTKTPRRKLGGTLKLSQDQIEQVMVKKSAPDQLPAKLHTTLGTNSIPIPPPITDSARSENLPQNTEDKFHDLLYKSGNLELGNDHEHTKTNHEKGDADTTDILAASGRRSGIITDVLQDSAVNPELSVISSPIEKDEVKIPPSRLRDCERKAYRRWEKRAAAQKSRGEDVTPFTYPYKPLSKDENINQASESTHKLLKEAQKPKRNPIEERIKKASHQPAMNRTSLFQASPDDDSHIEQDDAEIEDGLEGALPSNDEDHDKGLFVGTSSPESESVASSKPSSVNTADTSFGSTDEPIPTHRQEIIDKGAVESSSAALDSNAEVDKFIALFEDQSHEQIDDCTFGETGFSKNSNDTKINDNVDEALATTTSTGASKLNYKDPSSHVTHTNMPRPSQQPIHRPTTILSGIINAMEIGQPKEVLQTAPSNLSARINGTVIDSETIVPVKSAGQEHEGPISFAALVAGGRAQPMKHSRQPTTPDKTASIPQAARKNPTQLEKCSKKRNDVLKNTPTPEAADYKPKSHPPHRNSLKMVNRMDSTASTSTEGRVLTEASTKASPSTLKSIFNSPKPMHDPGAIRRRTIAYSNPQLPSMEGFYKLPLNDPAWVLVRNFLQNGIAEPKYLRHLTSHQSLLRDMMELKESKEARKALKAAKRGSDKQMTSAAIMTPTNELTDAKSSPRKQQQGPKPDQSKKSSPSERSITRPITSNTPPVRDRHGRFIKQVDTSSTRKASNEPSHRINKGGPELQSSHQNSPACISPFRRELERERSIGLSPVHEHETPASAVRPSSSSPDRPKYAGKQINDLAVQAYYASLKENELFGGETAEEAEEAANRHEREPSPVTERDEFHFVYCIKRKQWTIEEDESDTNWFAVQNPAFYSLEEANSAALRETLIERRGMSAGPSFTSQHLEKNNVGMLGCLISIPEGCIQIKVERVLRCKGKGQLPAKKSGWHRSRVWWIKKKSWKRCRRNINPVSNTKTTAIDENDENDSLFDEPIEDHTNNEESGGDENVAADDDEDDDDKYSLLSEGEEQHPDGVWTIQDHANRVAGRWMLDELFDPNSARIDVVNDRFAHGQEIEKQCDKLKSERGALYLSTVIDGGARKVAVWVEGTNINGPKNI